jgi:hypothetical protein
MKDVHPDVNGASPIAPAMISISVVSMGDRGLAKRYWKLRNIANPSSALCMGIEFTMPACKPKYIFVRHTPEPRRTAQAIAPSVMASLTVARGWPRATAVEGPIFELSAMTGLICLW